MSMKDRSARRIRTSCRLAYVGITQDLEGEAQIVDLSFKGCRAFCPSPPSVGTKLQVSVYLSDMEHPVSVELAIVRWVKQTMMGLEFCSVQLPHRERLQAWVMKAPYGSSKGVRTPPSLVTARDSRSDMVPMRATSLTSFGAE